MLTDKEISNLKPRDKAYRVADGGGLFVEVRPDGKKYWRQAYRFAGKQKMLAHGVYPSVSAKAARVKRDEAKALLDQGTDPGQQRKVEKLTKELASALTFEAVAREWHSSRSAKLSDKTNHKTIVALEQHVFQHLGALPIADIEAAHIAVVVKKLDTAGKGETSRRVRSWIDAVFRYAILHGKTRTNPAAAIRCRDLGLGDANEKHFASLAIADLPAFLRAVDDPAKPVDYRTRLALQLLLLTFVRPGELAWAKWNEFNFDAREWRIPPERVEGKGRGMKMREEHVVPLSDQALAALEQLRPLTGRGEFLFPCIGDPTRGMSDNTLRQAIQRGLGFPVTAHGMRATATSALLELGWPAHIIDKQLAHREHRGATFGAYSHQAEYLPERRQMMEAWGLHLQALKAGAKITPIRSKAA